MIIYKVIRVFKTIDFKVNTGKVTQSVQSSKYHHHLWDSLSDNRKKKVSNTNFAVEALVNKTYRHEYENKH